MQKYRKQKQTTSFRDIPTEADSILEPEQRTLIEFQSVQTEPIFDTERGYRGAISRLCWISQRFGQ
jgi:hypothetical protein